MKNKNTTTVAIPELKKGQTVVFYGARFEILEDSKNVYDNERRLPFEQKPEHLQTFAAKARFLQHINAEEISLDKLVEKYDVFQGNSLATIEVEA